MTTIVRPPGPPCPFFGLPIAKQIQRDLLGFYESARQTYGDVMHMQFGPYHDYTFFHPDAIQEVLIGKAKSFIRMKRPIEVLRQWNGDGLLITEGETWRRHRRLVQPAFQPSRIGRYVGSIVAANRELLDRWTSISDASHIDFEAGMTSLTMEITGRALFGTSLRGEAEEISRAVRTLSEVAVREMFMPFTLPDWLPLPGKAEKRRAIGVLDQLVRRFVSERRASSADAGDLLSMLLMAVDEEGDGQGLTDEQARDQCMTFFLAGHDTTAAGLTWIGWALATHPEAAQRAAAEVQKVIGKREPTYEDVPQLEYLSRVIKETLRRYPPAVGLVAREATQDVEIGGWHLPAGSLARVMTYTVHHDQRWFPDPQKFDPDRFAPGRAESIPHCAYLPFGAGPRACIGQGLATLEMTLFTAQLLQRFRLSPAAGQNEPLLDPRMSLRPVGGLYIRLERL
ncbi:MAG: cytochrome P450 [Pirellulales bacterium]